jgi:hypothetical protein
MATFPYSYAALSVDMMLVDEFFRLAPLYNEAGLILLGHLCST